MKLSRDDYRKIKSFSKDQMERWLDYDRSMTYNQLRKEFEKAYHDEVDNAVSNFLIAIAYTLHYNEELHLQQDELNSFMEDMFVSVDMFRKGEYKPEEYEEELKKDGIQFAKFDYSKLYREHDKMVHDQYKQQIEDLQNQIKELRGGN